MSKQMRLPQPLAVPLLIQALRLAALRGPEDSGPQLVVGSYDTLRRVVNPLRAAQGFTEITAPDGVRGGASLDIAMERIQAQVYGGRSPLIVPLDVVAEEAYIRRTYGLEVLNQWRQLKHEQQRNVANLTDLESLFGPGGLESGPGGPEPAGA